MPGECGDRKVVEAAAAADDTFRAPVQEPSSFFFVMPQFYGIEIKRGEVSVCCRAGVRPTVPRAFTRPLFVALSQQTFQACRKSRLPEASILKRE